MTNQRAEFEAHLPSSTLTQLDAWVNKGQLPKDEFLRAVIANDLRRAFHLGFRSPNKLGYLPDLVNYFEAYIPEEAWGMQALDSWKGLT